MTDEPDLKQEAIRLLCFWLPSDETARRKHVAEAVGRLWDRGLDVMIGTAVDLAAGLHEIDPRVRCFLHLGGFTGNVGMIGIISSVGPALIVPGCLALWGTCGKPESYELTPAELQGDLSICKPAGAAAMPLKKVTTEQLQGVVSRLVELVDGPIKPKAKRPWWRGWWGPKSDPVN